MIKRFLVFFVFLFITKLSNACVCDVPNIFLEFYASKYVFYGEIISKTYPKDSLTYTFTFKIEKHFKDGDRPENLTFTWPSEPKYRDKVYSDCDYEVNIGDKLLVFAQNKNGKLNFGLNCSNSSKGLSLRSPESLKNAPRFKVLNYHLNFDYYFFNQTKPITNIDSIMTPFKSNKYSNIKEGVIIMFDVDTNGLVSKSNIWVTNGFELNKIDSLVGTFDIINKEYRLPENNLEKDALDISKKIKKWQIMRFKQGGMAVNSRQYLMFSVDKNEQIQYKQFFYLVN